jgi:hypothetical protein
MVRRGNLRDVGGTLEDVGGGNLRDVGGTLVDVGVTLGTSGGALMRHLIAGLRRLQIYSLHPKRF